MIGSVQHHRALLGLLPSKCDAHASIIEPLLVDRYGPGRRPGPEAPLMFGDDQTDAYLSRMAAGRSETLFVNVEDRDVWRLAGGVVIMG